MKPEMTLLVWAVLLTFVQMLVAARRARTATCWKTWRCSRRSW